MKNLLRIIVGVLIIALGAGLVFFSVSALLHATDWVAVLMYICLILISMAFAAIGLAVTRGENIKDMLRDLFSGISF